VPGKASIDSMAVPLSKIGFFASDGSELDGSARASETGSMGALDMLSPAIFGCVAWGGLWLRETPLEQLLRLKHKAQKNQEGLSEK